MRNLTKLLFQRVVIVSLSLLLQLAVLFLGLHRFSDYFPWYNAAVGIVALVLTLVIELPACYNMIGTEPSNRKRLLWTLAGANTVTTVMTAAVERLLCYGRW